MWQPPNSYVLNIVAPRRVVQWNGDTLKDIFVSDKQSIIAATQATDGSHMLAVADGRLVCIQDTEQDLLRRTHILAETSGRAQLLQFAKGTEELYFTTNLDNTIRCYQVRRNNLQKPLCELPQPPTSLAVSRRYLIAACDNPPKVVLRALSSEGQTFTVSPLASPANVTSAALHPKRPDVFLLAFRDGSVSIHSAAKIYRRPTCNGQVGFIGSLNARDETLDQGLFAAEFMSGVSLRVVIVENEGTCRIISFYKGRPTISHIWMMPTGVTAFAVLPKTEDEEERVTVGTSSGEVSILDLTGTLIRRFRIDLQTETIVGLEWVAVEPKAAKTNDDAVAINSAAVHSPEKSQASEGTVIVRPNTNAAHDLDGSGPKTGSIGKSVVKKLKSKALSKRKSRVIAEFDENMTTPEGGTADSPLFVNVTSGPSHNTQSASAVTRKPVPSSKAERPSVVEVSDGTTDGTSFGSTSTVTFEPNDHLGAKHRKLFQRFRSVKPAQSRPLPSLQTIEQSPSPTPANPPSSSPEILVGASRPEAQPQPSPATLDEPSQYLQREDRLPETIPIRPDPFASSSTYTASSVPPLTNAQKIYQKRRLTTPKRSDTWSDNNGHGFDRPATTLSSVDSAVMRDTFKDFSSGGTVDRRSDEATGDGAALRRQQQPDEVAALREQVAMLSRQLSELGHLVRENRRHTSEPPSSEPYQIHRHHTGCCASDVLQLMLRNTVNAGPYAADERHSHRTFAGIPSPHHYHHRSYGSGSSSAGRSYRSTHRRHNRSTSRPGWIKVGKFQVRRVRRESRESSASASRPKKRTEWRLVRESKSGP